MGSDRTQPAADAGVWNTPLQGPCPPHFPNCNDPPPPPADTTPPVVQVNPASAELLSTVVLRFTLSDDSGRASWKYVIRRDGAVIGQLESPAVANGSYTISQGISIRGTYEWCIQATDAAGNTSVQSCAAITVGDTRAPQVKAAPVTADVPLVRKRGKVITLPWTASDDSFRATFTVTVFNFGKALWSQTYPESSVVRDADTESAKTKSAQWPIPAGGFARGSSPEHWCVQAADPSGNSAKSCAAITLTGDRYAPMVEALRSTAWAGQVASLRFKVNDPDNGSHKAKRTVTLYRDGRLIWQRQVDGGALLPARAGDIYAEQWSTPATLAGANLQFCVLATDAAGNSAKDCATITLTRDTTPPKVHALPASGRRGQTINLRYTVSDNSGQTSDEYAVYAVSGFSQKLIARNATKLGPVGNLSSVRFYLPLTLRPGLIFCVVSRDAAGNTSVKSCAAITLT